MSTSARWAALAAAVIVSAITADARAQDARLATVDLHRALNGTADGRCARERLRRLYEERQRDLDARREELERARERIRERLSARAYFEPGVLERWVVEFRAALDSLQATYERYRRELEETESALTDAILDRTYPILYRLAAEGAYTWIDDDEDPRVASATVDITDALIQAYDDDTGGARLSCEQRLSRLASGEPSEAP